MSTITSIQATDVVADSRAFINTNFSNLNTDKVETLSDLGLTEAAADYNLAAQQAAALVLPSGAIWLWSTGTAPTGWLLCRGQEVSRTTYADLFAVISTTYGVGNGSTTFNVPDLQGRVPVGFDSGQTEFDALAETGGAKTHTLTIAEMPAHTHGIGGNGSGGAQAMTTLTEAYTVESQSTGGGGAHNNLQPYLVLNYIIKT